MRSYAAALTALALAHDAAAFKVPVSSRAIHTTVRAQFARVRTPVKLGPPQLMSTAPHAPPSAPIQGRRAAVVRYATAEELLAQAAALREEGELHMQRGRHPLPSL